MVFTLLSSRLFRAFTLPEAVDFEKIHAELRDGVLALGVIGWARSAGPSHEAGGSSTKKPSGERLVASITSLMSA